MRIFAITKAGLFAMTISVMALWGCIALEKSALRQGVLDARASAAALERLRQPPLPVSEPSPDFRSQPLRAS